MAEIDAEMEALFEASPPGRVLEALKAMMEAIKLAVASSRYADVSDAEQLEVLV